MEKIKERSMKTFVLSSLINFGIGTVIGIIVAIIVVIDIGVGGLAGFLSVLLIALSIGLVFALLTNNMYRIYFYYLLSLDVNAACKGDGIETENSLVQAVLSSLTLGLYGVYWQYKLAQRIRVNAPRYGFKMLATGKEIAVLGAFSFGFLSAWELLNNMNKIAKVYNSTGLADMVGGVQ